MALATLVGCQAVDVHPDDRAPRQRIQTMWRIQLTDLEPVTYYPKETATPAYGAGGRVVIAGTRAGTVVCANAKTGRELWRFDTKGKIRGGVTTTKDAVYFGGTDGQLYRLDLRSGAEDWDKPYRTKGAISSAPVVAGGKVIFQNGENRTYAIDTETGGYVWDHGRPSPDFLTIKGEGGVTVDGDRVYSGYDDGFLVASRLEDGATMWSKNLSGDQRQFVDVDTRPAVDNESVYVSSFATGLYAVGKKHGNIKWLYRSRGIKTPAMDSKALYVVNGARHIEAIDKKTGKRMWTSRFDYGDELGDPVLRGQLLWVPTGSGLLMMDAERASVLARISPDHGQSGAVSTRGGWVHMVTNSGALVGARIL